MGNRVFLVGALVMSVFISACGYQPPAQPVWSAVGANNSLVTPGVSSGSATAVVKNVSCSPENPSAYSVDVEWLSSVPKGERAVLEYRISKKDERKDNIGQFKTALTFDLEGETGISTFEVANNEIEDPGDAVIVNFAVQKKEGGVVKSTPDSYPVVELCLK